MNNEVPPEKFGEMVVGAVAEAYGVTPEKLRDRTRLRELDEARGIALYLVRMHTELGWRRVGRVLGRESFSSRYPIETAVERMRENPRVADRVRDLELKLGLSGTVDGVLSGGWG